MTTEATPQPHSACSSYLDVTRNCLSAMQAATTAAELRVAVDGMLALPGMWWPKRSHTESLLTAVHEQRELTRLSDIDMETGLLNRRRFGRALRDSRSTSDAGSTESLRIIVVRLPHASELWKLLRAAHGCASALRPGDLAARIGHRRLGVILPATSHAVALAVAVRLRQVLVSSQRAPFGPGLSVRVISRSQTVGAS